MPETGELTLAFMCDSPVEPLFLRLRGRGKLIGNESQSEAGGRQRSTLIDLVSKPTNGPSLPRSE